jgi:8-oxo-dGTP pyrophosphatase MutT (NUDIX family)
MEQKYKIFLRNMPVVVTANPPDGVYDETAILTFNTDHSDRLKETIDNIEADTKHKIAYLVTPDPDATFQAFKSHFQPVEAAGGIVWNPDGAILLIFRHGKWDLPKGKIEQNESIAEAAEREVAEECGIRELTLNHFYGTSYHTYWQFNQRMLKITYWYDMSCTDPQNINPQTEEGIETIRWMDTQGLQRAMDQTFPNLYGIFDNYLKRVPL